MRLIFLYLGCFFILSSCINGNKDSHAKTSENLVKQPITCESNIVYKDTLFIKDSLCVLFLGTSYENLYSEDKKIIKKGGFNIVTVADNYTDINFNNLYNLNICDRNRNSSAILYEKGKNPIIFDSSFACQLSRDYFGNKNLTTVIEDGVYLATELSHAAYIGDLDKIKSLVNNGDDINAIGMYDYTFAYDALFAAIVGEQYEIIEYLIRNGANVNSLYTESYSSPLSLIASLTNKKKVVELGELLIKNGANVNGCSLSSYIPIIEAISSRNVGLIKLLINSNANLNLDDKNNNYLKEIILDCFDGNDANEILSLMGDTRN
ncbi:MAG: ankyrin repeat domain-containing protein [Rikenellaceae bacterium]